MGTYTNRSTDDQQIPKLEEGALNIASLAGDAIVTFKSTEPTSFGAQARESAGWGAKYSPPVKDARARQEFQRICADLAREVRDLEEVLQEGRITEEGAGVVAEVLGYLERLYDCPFGEDESLKGAIVALQSQLNNLIWTVEQVDFLREAVAFLGARYIVDSSTVEEINDMIERHEFDFFRGTVSEPEVIQRYKIVPISDEG